MKTVLVCVFSAVIFFSCSRKSSVESMERIKTYPNGSVEYVYRKDGSEREFILCMPDDQEVVESESVPLVFVLHGYGNTALGFMDEVHLEKSACPKGYAVCYVSGKSNPASFNSRRCWSYGYDEWSRKDIDGLQDLAVYLQKKFGFNPGKTAVVGFSNGAIMANKIAVEKSETFSAVVSVAGMMSSDVWSEAQKKDPEKISAYFQINGTADEIVPLRISKKASYNPMPPFEEDVLEFISGKRIDDVEVSAPSERTKILRFNGRVWWALIQDETHRWPKENWSGIDVGETIIDFLEGVYE